MDIAMVPYINTLGRFCGIRDIPSLTRSALRDRYGFDNADVMVLFGGSILCGGDLLAEAMHEGIAKKYIIVGGAGHTTPTLRDKMHALFSDWDTSALPEAELFNGYLQRKYNLRADMLETHSTNCGNNITFMLKLLDDGNHKFDSIILTQDATMQRRMAAGLRKYRPDLTVINYASYSVEVIVENGVAAYDGLPDGMWDIERYTTLLTGEIPRLRDDANGYGPNGGGYIAHEDIPNEVMQAYEAIKKYDDTFVRSANSAYANPK